MSRSSARMSSPMKSTSSPAARSMPRLRAAPGPAASCRKYRNRERNAASLQRLLCPIRRSIVDDHDLELLRQDRLPTRARRGRRAASLCGCGSAPPRSRAGRASRESVRPGAPRSRAFGSCNLRACRAEIGRDLDQPVRCTSPGEVAHHPRAPARACFDGRDPRRHRPFASGLEGCVDRPLPTSADW